MKIESYIIIFLIFVLSYIYTDNVRMDNLKRAQFDYDYVDRVFQNAFDDAFSTLLYSSEINHSFQKSKANELVVDNFFKSIQKSLALSSEELLSMKLHFPFVIIIDDDGFYVYALQKVKSGRFEEYKFVFMPKQFFSHVENGVVYSFDLSGEISARFVDSNEVMIERGSVEELLSTSNNADKFIFLRQDNIEEKIKKIMLSQLNGYLNSVLKNHVIFSRSMGYRVEVDFNILNNIDEDMISSRSFLVYSSGVPVSNHLKYSNLEFKKVVSSREEEYYGFEEGGVLYFAKSNSDAVIGREILASFSNRKSAAKSGYHIYRD